MAEISKDARARLTELGLDVGAMVKELSAIASPSRAVDDLKSLVEAGGDFALRAALQSRFLLADIGAADGSAAARKIVEFSEIIPTEAGRAWRLRDEARKAVIDAARQSGTLERLQKLPEGLDEAGRRLLASLRGERPDLDKIPTEELTCLAVDLAALEGGAASSGLKAAEVQREVRLRALLDPFRALVERSVADGPDGSRDRFVGRAAELEQLRAYVGVIAAAQLRDSLRRSFNRLWAAVTFSDAPADPLIVHGMGGMGKSTLLAKFVLDHALYPHARLPLAYLDFDRAALAPRQPLQLLIEIAAQLELWLTEIEPELRELRGELRRELERQLKNADAARSEERTRSALRSFCRRLARIVEGVTKGQAPCLILFDTFEIVQFDRAALGGVAALIKAMRGDGAERWKSLRIVISGRAPVPEIETRQAMIELNALSLAETIQLIDMKCAREKVFLTPGLQAELAAPLRTSPLHVVIVVNWLKQFDSSEARSKAIAELSAEVKALPTGAGGGPLSAALVTGILMRRMIGHIREEAVRQIVDPGLIVRRVTPEAIAEVLAPAGGLVPPGKTLPIEAAKDLFERLGREIWLVSRRNDALVHRPEVRQAMLPLLRSRSAEIFEATNRQAIAFFQPRAENLEARAELIYHLLLSRPPQIEAADRLWTLSLVSLLATAPDDLEDVSAAYISARVNGALTLAALSLPRQILLDIVAANDAASLRELSSEAAHQLLSGEDVARSVELSGVRATFLFSTGRWRELAADAVSQNGALYRVLSAIYYDAADRLDRREATTAQNLLKWLARDPACDGAFDWSAGRSFAPTTPVSFAVDDAKRHATHAAATAAAALNRKTTWNRDTLLGAVAKARELWRTRPPKSSDNENPLRVLAILDEDPDLVFLRAFNFPSHFLAVCPGEYTAFRELAAFVSQLPRLSAETREALDLARRWLASAPLIEKTGETLTDPSDIGPFGAIVSTLAPTHPHSALIARRMLTLTHADWVGPLGEALTRAFDGRPSLVKIGGGGWFADLRNARSTRPLPKDATGVHILSFADEAGRLAETVEAYVASDALRPAREEAQDFIALAEKFAAWRKMLRAATASPTAAPELA
jgi:hypothetical protein